MDIEVNLLDLIDQGLSVEDDHLGPCVGDDDVPEVPTGRLELGPCVGDDLEELGPCVGDDSEQLGN